VEVLLLVGRSLLVMETPGMVLRVVMPVVLVLVLIGDSIFLGWRLVGNKATGWDAHMLLWHDLLMMMVN